VYFLQLLIIGLLAGAVYALIGVGFTLVLGIGRIPNFAQGAFVGLGLYFALFMKNQFGASPYEALAPGIVFFAVVGVGCAELFERRGRRIGEIGELLVGLALLMVLQGLFETLYGDNPREINGSDLGYVHVARIGIPGAMILAAATTLIIALAMYGWLQRSRWGRAMRAVTENPMAAGLYGIRVPVIQRTSVTLSILLAGVAGVLISPFTVLTPNLGSAYLITAFAVVLVGGIGNTLGALVAGLAIGVVDSLTGGYLASYWTTLAPLILITAFLVLRRGTVVAA
jgi:branched-subunit amino acid ABC-type transport system permease component